MKLKLWQETIIYLLLPINPGKKRYILHIDAENKQYKLDFCPQLLSKYLETWKAL